MRSLLIAAVLCLVVSSSAAVTADARCFGRLCGFRPLQGLASFVKSRPIRSRFGGRFGVGVRSARSSGCADCAAHGVGPDGFRLKGK